MSEQRLDEDMAMFFNVRNETIDACIAIVKKRLVGWSIHPAGLAVQDAAEEMLEEMETLRNAP